MTTNILVADYSDANHAKDIGFLLNQYAVDDMGGGEVLSADITNRVAKELSKLPHAFSIICYVDDKPAGLVNCFETLSTFNCKPLINIHDFVVANEFRGQGLAKNMLREVELIARKKGCCKITLEVLDRNSTAMSLYQNFGFADYQLDPQQGKALFWQKLLPEK